MKYTICQNRDCLRRMKRAHQYRALLKRREAEALRRQRDDRNGKGGAQ